MNRLSLSAAKSHKRLENFTNRKLFSDKSLNENGNASYKYETDDDDFDDDVSEFEVDDYNNKYSDCKYSHLNQEQDIDDEEKNFICKKRKF